MNTQNTSGNSRFLRLPEVCEIVGFSDSELYRQMKAGTFPKQLKIGPKAVRWDESQVRAWMDEQRSKQALQA